MLYLHPPSKIYNMTQHCNIPIMAAIFLNYSNIPFFSFWSYYQYVNI